MVFIPETRGQSPAAGGRGAPALGGRTGAARRDRRTRGWCSIGQGGLIHGFVSA